MLVLYIFAALIAAGTTILFALLKQFALVQWSWVWVLSPIWVLWILLLVAMIIAYISIAISDKKEKARRSGL